MAKRGATSQITREGGGLDEEDENESKATEDGTTKQVPEPFVRKIRPLPSSRLGSAKNSPIPTPAPSSTPSSTPAFGGGFSFGSSASTSAPAVPVFGSGSSSSSTTSKPSTGFSFGSSSSTNPFAASTGSTTPPVAASAQTAKIPSNPFASISLPQSKPTGPSFSFNPPSTVSTPPSNLSGSDPAPAKVPFNPFGSSSSTTPSTSFGAASTMTPASKLPAFSFNSASTQPFAKTTAQASVPSSPAIPPAPTISLPWGPTTSGTLPKLPIDKPSAIDRLRPASPTESTIVEAPTSPRPRSSKVVPLAAGGSTSPDGSKSSSLSSTTAYPFPSASDSVTASSQPLAPTPSFSLPTASDKNTTSAPVPTENGVDKKLVDHYLSQRGLNHSLLVLLQSLVEKDPFRDLSQTLSDLAGSYAVNRLEIDQTDAAVQAASVSSTLPQKAEAPKEEAKTTPSAPVVPPMFASSGGFSFGGAKVPSTNGTSAGSSSSASPSGFPVSSFGASSTPSTGGFSFGGASSTPSGTAKPSGFTFGGKPLTAETGAGAATGGFSFGSTPTVKPSTSSETPAKKPSTTSSGAGSIVKSVLAAEDSEKASREEAAKKEKEKEETKDAPKGGLFSFTSSTTPSTSPFSFGAVSTSSTTESPSKTAAAAATPGGAAPTPPSFQRLSSGTPNFSFGAASPGGRARTPSSSFSFGSASAPAPAPASTTGSGPVFPSPLSAGGSVPATAAAAVPVSAPTPPTGGEATGGDEEPPAPTIPSDPTLMEKGVGEEDEDTTWEGKSSINKFDDGKWVKVGVGLVRVKKGGESGDRGRVLGRTEGTGNVLINFACHADLTPRIQQGKSIMLQGFDKTKPMQYLLRVKDASTAQALLAALEERVQAGKA